MSKEATGQFNTKIGSSGYWVRLNRGAGLSSLMSERTNYRTMLHQVGTRASGAIEEIYTDMSELGGGIRRLSASDRKALAKQVEELYDVCRMAGVTAKHSSECIQGLNLSAMSPWSGSFRNEQDIEKAISVIEKSRYSGNEAVKLLKEAARWGITSAAERDPKKREFLQAVSLGNGDRFLQDVAEEYQSRTGSQRREGRGGQTVASRAYRNQIELQVFGYVLPGFGEANYERMLRDALSSVAEQLDRDLDNAMRENDYITDETAAKLKAAASELGQCGVNTGSLNSKIEKLAWFVGGDSSKIRRLQQTLNKLGYDLIEDGVFGAKTLNVLNDVHGELARGTFPALAWVDPLQSKITGIEFRKIPSTHRTNTVDYASFLDLSSRSQNIKGGKNRGITVFRADQHKTSPYHINTVSGEQLGKGEYIPSSALQQSIINKLNHKTIDERTYRILKDFDQHAKKIRVAGKVMAVTGAALDVLEIAQTIHIDTHDADRKLGKTTYSTLASIGGSWSLGALGAKGGAMLGASIGTAILPGVGTAVGGAVGGLVLGIAGSYSGGKLGEYVIDITMTE